MQLLPVEFLKPGPYQPRQHIDPDALQELANSLKTQGMIQPIVVRQVKNQQYEIIAGERRWRAAQLAQLSQVPVIVRDVTAKVATAIALIENIQRADLNAFEEMMALQQLQNEYDMTHQDIAEAVGKSRATVSNLLRLAQLEKSVLLLLKNNAIELGHAKVLLAVTGMQQISVAEQVVQQQLSVRATELLVKQYQDQKKGPIKVIQNKHADPDIVRLQKQLTDRLGTRVILQHQNNGRGKIVIEYHSLDQMEGVLEKIK
jgi:ParB family chromosome partitioning protein